MASVRLVDQKNTTLYFESNTDQPSQSANLADQLDKSIVLSPEKIESSVKKYTIEEFKKTGKKTGTMDFEFFDLTLIDDEKYDAPVKTQEEKVNVITISDDEIGIKNDLKDDISDSELDLSDYGFEKENMPPEKKLRVS